MDRDGTKSGFDLELTRAVSDAVAVPVIASGGVGNLQHLADGVTTGRANAVLAASIFHYGEYTVRQAKEFMAAQGIRSEEHTSELQSLMRTSYAVFCLKKKKSIHTNPTTTRSTIVE